MSAQRPSRRAIVLATLAGGMIAMTDATSNQTAAAAGDTSLRPFKDHATDAQ